MREDGAGTEDLNLPQVDEVIADAETSLGRSPEERWAMFCSVQELVGCIWSRLSKEEMRRRLAIADSLDARPDPWWRDVKPEGLP